jgi:Fe-S-cluster containining protein
MENTPCLGCGACCFGEHERYVPVSGSDYAVLDELAARLTVFHGNRCYMRMHGGHCAALEIHANGEFYCSVYERRPAVCRELQRGSSACEAEYVRKRATSRGAHLTLLAEHRAANDVLTSRPRSAPKGRT